MTGLTCSLLTVTGVTYTTFPFTKWWRSIDLMCITLAIYSWSLCDHLHANIWIWGFHLNNHILIGILLLYFYYHGWGNLSFNMLLLSPLLYQWAFLVSYIQQLWIYIFFIHLLFHQVGQSTGHHPFRLIHLLLTRVEIVWSVQVH